MATTFVSLFSLASVRGELITVVNSSFETPIAAPGQFVGAINSAPSGWSVYNTKAPDTFRYFGVFNPNSSQLYYDPVPDGNNIGVVFLRNDFALAEAGLRQTLGSTLQLNTLYQLQVEVGNMAFDPDPDFDDFDFTGFPGYRVELLSGSTVIATDNNTLLPDEGRFLTSTVQFQTGGFHANAGQALGIRLVNLNGPGIEVNFDHVRLESFSAVPEPGSFVLTAACVGGWWAKRRRSKIDKC